MDKQSQKQRLEGFLSLINTFPSETPAGPRQDEIQRERLKAELDQLQLGLNALSSLSRAGNALSRFIATVKRP